MRPKCAYAFPNSHTSMLRMDLVVECIELTATSLFLYNHLIFQNCKKPDAFVSDFLMRSLVVM